MSSGIKYVLLFFLCMFFVLSSFGILGYLAFLYTNGVVLDKNTYIIFLCLCGGFFLLAYFIRSFLRNAREDLEAERNRTGRGKTFGSMTKKERELARIQAAMNNEALLSSSEYRNLIQKGVKDPDEKLDALVGMKDVKKAVLRYKAQISGKKNIGSKHMCFLGNPGTGKTTVVSILTAYLYKFGYIKRNEFISVDGNFFKAGTDPIARTNLLLGKARGKVLFIDEAYSIVQGNTGAGQEILATILNEMENNREDMIVIFAGYKKEMKDLFSANSGLASRIKNYFLFDDYTMDEMKQIFTDLMNKENLVPTAEAMEKAEEVLAKKKTRKNFANARTVRNLAEKSITEHAYNLMAKNHKEKYRLMPEDVRVDEKEDEYFS